jgi:hypothetical protein
MAKTAFGILSQLEKRIAQLSVDSGQSLVASRQSEGNESEVQCPASNV